MPKTYMFIPFSNEENNKDLKLVAEGWAKTQSERKKDKCEILIYQKDDIPQLGAEDQIYVLAHGVPDEIDAFKRKDGLPSIINTQDVDQLKQKQGVDAGGYLMSPIELAKRMYDAGLKLSLSSKAKIKLFFCDENERAKEVAQLFMKELLAQNQEFKKSEIQVAYYRGHISSPMEMSLTSLDGVVEKKGIHKHSVRPVKSTDPKSSRKKTEMMGEVVYLGRASEARGILFFKDISEPEKEKTKTKDPGMDTTKPNPK